MVDTAKSSGQADRYTETAYDVLGNKVTQRDYAGRISTFRYDALSRLIWQTAPFEGDTRSEREYVYDKVGNLVRDRARRGENSWREIQYSYDDQNRLTETAQYLDEEGQASLLTRYTYDNAGNKTALYTGLTQNPEDLPAITRYTYDRMGNMTSLLDPRSGTLAEGDPLRRLECYHYDLTGQLTGKTDRNGTLTTYTYDAMGRVIEERATAVNPFGTVESIRITGYAKTGQKIREAKEETGSPPLTIYYRYDAVGRLTSQSDPEGVEKTYAYDLGGNRSGFTLTRNGEPAIDLSYGYDHLNRLETVSREGIEIARYTYDVNGNRKSLAYPNGIVVEYTYNEGNLVKTLVNRQDARVRTAFSYTYSLDGNQLSKTTVMGQESEVVTTYAYDFLGRLTGEEETGGDAISYTYDRFSNRSQMGRRDFQGKVYLTDYIYNSNNWLEQQVTVQGEETQTFSYRYDANGNQVYRRQERTAPAGTAGVRRLGFAHSGFPGGEPTLETREYNGFGQTISVCRDGERSRYCYRPDGLYAGTTKNGVMGSTEQLSKSFIWDGTNIVAEVDGNGNITAKYLRGINLIARETPAAGLEYYQFNAHGDVIALTDQSGNVRKQYDYDSFGNEREPDPNDTNPFRYCAEMYEKETGTYYLRARRYQPTIGRFLSPDTHWNPSNMIYGDNPLKINERQDPLGLNIYTYVPDLTAIMQSGNLYVYGMNNPILYVDKDGKIGILATMAI